MKHLVQDIAFVIVIIMLRSLKSGLRILKRIVLWFETGGEWCDGCSLRVDWNTTCSILFPYTSV